MEHNESNELITINADTLCLAQSSFEEQARILEEVARRAGVLVSELISAITASIEYLADKLRELNELTIDTDDVVFKENECYIHLIYYKAKIINNSKIVNIIILYNRWKLYWVD